LIAVSAFSGVAQAAYHGVWQEPSSASPYLSPIQLQPYSGYSEPAYEQPMQRAYEKQLQQQRDLNARENQIRREQQSTRRRSRSGESLLAPRYFSNNR